MLANRHHFLVLSDTDLDLLYESQCMSHEDFDVRSLATYLHLTPDQVSKMADRGKLPGRRIGGQWKFSRAEIHLWFEQRIGASDEQELVQVEKVLVGQPNHDSQDVSIGTLLPESNIVVPLLARTKNSVIEKLCQFAADSGQIWESNKMADAIRAREDLHPTALDNGVALLHPRRPQVNNLSDSFICLGITSSGIPFGGPRGALTDTFFLIASNDEAIHLRILARLSRLLQREDLLSEMRESSKASEVWSVIHRYDSEVA